MLSVNIWQTCSIALWTPTPVYVSYSALISDTGYTKMRKDAKRHEKTCEKAWKVLEHVTVYMKPSRNQVVFSKRHENYGKDIWKDMWKMRKRHEKTSEKTCEKAWKVLEHVKFCLHETKQEPSCLFEKTQKDTKKAWKGMWRGLFVSFRVFLSLVTPSDTGFERDSNRIFHPQLYFRYFKHLLKLYNNTSEFKDETSLAARLAAMAATRSETSWIADGTVTSLVQTHSDRFHP